MRSKTVHAGEGTRGRDLDAALERLEGLEDAVLGYFAGHYPRGTCADREEAVGTLYEAANRARERELETLEEAAGA